MSAVPEQPHTTVSGSIRHLGGLDGLRGIAALLVLVTHTRQFFAPDLTPRLLRVVLDLGGEGLTLFFVLSGFLLSLPFARSFVRQEPLPKLTRYLKNRFLRIFPAYWVILLTVALVFNVAVLRPAHNGETAVDRPVGQIASPTQLVANASATQTYFPGMVTSGITPAWSLSVEIAFYVLLPVLWVSTTVMARRSDMRMPLGAFVPAIAMLAIGSLSYGTLQAIVKPATALESYWLHWGDTGTAVFSRSLLANAHLFAFGLAASTLFIFAQEGLIGPSKIGKVIALGWISSLIVIPLSYIVGWTSLGFSFAFAVLVLSLTVRPNYGLTLRLYRLLEIGPLKFAGLVSYSVYLWHMPVILWLRDQGIFFRHPGLVGLVANILLVVVLTLFLSTLTYYLVEKPALGAKKKRQFSRLMPSQKSI